MKSTIEFTLPEEQDELTHALNGAKYLAIIDQFSGWLRNQEKHADLCDEKLEYLKVVRENWFQFKDIWGVNDGP